MNAEQILKITMHSGRILLSSGAEVYRVEETIVRILKALNTNEAESFVTQGGIFISFEYEGITHTKVIRTTQSGFNLYRINRVNQASRDLCNQKIDVERFESIITATSNSPVHTKFKERYLAAIIALSFTLFYKGTIVDALWASMIGFAMKSVYQNICEKKINNFVTIGISSFVITILAYTLKFLGIIVNVDSVIIGTAMNLVPGLAITNAIRDSFEKDYLSGLTRCVEAFLIALAMALGSGFGMSIMLAIQGGRI